MPTFSKTSMQKLYTCHPDLIRLASAVVAGFDCTVVSGHRSQEEQEKLFEQGLSKTKFPKSKHNESPSRAIDLVPHVRGKGAVFTERMCYYFSGYVKRVAEEIGIAIRSGADWDKDNDTSDQRFNDPCHFELV